MAIFVVDPSATLAWCFEDESTVWADGLLGRLRRGDQIVVPAHWPTEVLNGLLFATRKKRIKTEKRVQLLSQIRQLPFEIEGPLFNDKADAVLTFSEKPNLTVYDAAYLELAQRRGLPLATLDTELRAAAENEGVSLL